MLNKTLRFSYVTAGPEITAYCQFTDSRSSRVRQEISKIKTRAVIDRSKLAEFTIPRNNFVETLVQFDCSEEMNNCYDRMKNSRPDFIKR